jgi:hypothetical protein
VIIEEQTKEILRRFSQRETNWTSALANGNFADIFLHVLFLLSSIYPPILI